MEGCQDTHEPVHRELLVALAVHIGITRLKLLLRLLRCRLSVLADAMPSATD